MMIAAMILVVSLAFFFQFFVVYCRSLIAAYNEAELSPDAREVTGIEDHIVNGDDFRRMVQLVRICPDLADDGRELRAVSLYYRMVSGLRRLLHTLAPNFAEWLERERQSCVYFAAVALDRRIAQNRDLFAQHLANRI
jgi:hypothetical protein